MQASEQTVIDLKQERDALQAKVQKLNDELLKLKKDSPFKSTKKLSKSSKCLSTRVRCHLCPNPLKTQTLLNLDGHRRSEEVVYKVPHTPQGSKKYLVIWKSFQASELRTACLRCGLMILWRLQQTVGGRIT